MQNCVVQRESNKSVSRAFKHNCNLQFFQERWFKTLVIMIEKGKGHFLGKLRTIQFVESDLQLTLKIVVSNRNNVNVETDARVSKRNY